MWYTLSKWSLDPWFQSTLLTLWLWCSHSLQLCIILHILTFMSVKKMQIRILIIITTQKRSFSPSYIFSSCDNLAKINTLPKALGSKQKWSLTQNTYSFFSVLDFWVKLTLPTPKFLKLFPSLVIYFYICYVPVYILYPQVFKLSLLACGRLGLVFLLMLLSDKFLMWNLLLLKFYLVAKTQTKIGISCP